MCADLVDAWTIVTLTTMLGGATGLFEDYRLAADLRLVG